MFYDTCLIHAYGPLHGGQGLLYIAVRGVALTHAENRRSIRHAGYRARLQRLFGQLASLALGHVKGGQHRGEARQCRWVDDPAMTKDEHDQVRGPAAVTRRCGRGDDLDEPVWAWR